MGSASRQTSIPLWLTATKELPRRRSMADMYEDLPRQIFRAVASHHHSYLHDGWDTRRAVAGANTYICVEA